MEIVKYKVVGVKVDGEFELKRVKSFKTMEQLKKEHPKLNKSSILQNFRKHLDEVVEEKTYKRNGKEYKSVQRYLTFETFVFKREE